MRYKLNINLQTKINFIDPIFFDSLLIYLYIKDLFGEVPQVLNLKEDELIKLPAGYLNKHKEGYYLASVLQYNKENDMQMTAFWTKHFDVKNSHFAKFKGQRKILTNKGDYRSYQMPMLLHGIDNAYFVFESEEVEAVRELLSKHFVALGKKRNRGWGLVKDWNIENTAEPIVRFAPAKSERTDIPKMFMRIKPPYWMMDNAQLCEMREV